MNSFELQVLHNYWTETFADLCQYLYVPNCKDDCLVHDFSGNRDKCCHHFKIIHGLKKLVLPRRVWSVEYTADSHDKHSYGLLWQCSSVQLFGNNTNEMHHVIRS
jgi:hypothetical protein